MHELTDLTTNRVYAGKIIPRSRLNRPYQKEKVSWRHLYLMRGAHMLHASRESSAYFKNKTVLVVLASSSRCKSTFFMFVVTSHNEL